MARKSNTVPYTNDRRAGRTHPGVIEWIGRDDPRSWGMHYLPNRADRRRAGKRTPIAAGTRRNPVSRYQRRHPEAAQR